MAADDGTGDGLPLRMPPLPAALRPIGAAYQGAVMRNGATAAGVGWSSPQGQVLRLRVLLSILDDDPADAVSLADIGCGYGALWPLLADRTAPRIGAYTGYDIVPRMVALARKAHGADPRARFLLGRAPEEPVDYAVISGTFNYRHVTPAAEWQADVAAALEEIAGRCRKGLAVNFLHRRGGRNLAQMFYTTPEAWTETAARLSRGGTVVVREDYLPDDFSLLIRFGR